MCRSNEPAFTPIRIGIPRSFAAFTTASTLWRRPILPGLIRTLSMPPSIALKEGDNQNEYQQQVEC